MVRTLRFVTLSACALVIGLGAIGCDKPASTAKASAPKVDNKMGGDKMGGDKMGDKAGDKMGDKDKK